MRYAFFLLPKPTEEHGIFKVPKIVRYAKTAEQAYDLALTEVPAGDRIWTWNEEPEGACTMCGGPFHEATGHWESRTRHWCGPCTRSMVKLLLDMQPRRWAGARFYDHARPPPAIDTSADDLRD